MIISTNRNVYVSKVTFNAFSNAKIAPLKSSKMWKATKQINNLNKQWLSFLSIACVYLVISVDDVKQPGSLISIINQEQFNMLWKDHNLD